ncbi:MAG: hypothetical protein E3J78_06485 [Candidatus Cloacimonadota bacterium]|nr:MAG: hypothetical protein E3J78_06485 [Candidatus Cloacimonadota bacterium]
MFKKTMILFVVLSISLVFMFSCSKKENPFDPNRGGYNDAEQMDLSFVGTLIPGQGGTITDQDPDMTGIQGEIVIYFLDFMNASTVTMSNIVVRDTTNGSAVQNATLTYYAELKKVVYRGEFSDDACFIVTLTSDLENEAGVQFDGNNNGWADGSPYDDYIYKLLTGVGVDTFDFDHPEISSVSPAVSNGTSVTPLITVNFTGGDIDTNTLITANVSLKYTSSGTPVTCTLVTRSQSFITIQPSSELDTATQYTVTVECSNIADWDENECLGFVGENMGYIANIPDYTWDFVTDDYGVSGFDGDPPTASASFTPGSEELIVSFNDYMVISTFNTGNIRVYDGNEQNLVGSIIPDLDERGFHYSLENAVSGTTYTLWIGPAVQEQAPGNWYLDGNGNGVGGEWDDEYTYTFTY